MRRFEFLGTLAAVVAAAPLAVVEAAPADVPTPDNVMMRGVAGTTAVVGKTASIHGEPLKAIHSRYMLEHRDCGPYELTAYDAVPSRVAVVGESKLPYTVSSTDERVATATIEEWSRVAIVTPKRRGYCRIVFKSQDGSGRSVPINVI